MLSPVEVTPPLSKALRYSSATDLRCSSVIVWVATATVVLLLCCGPSRDVWPERASSGAARQGRGTDGEAVGPEGIPLGFRGSRTPPGGDRWMSFPVERC